MVEYSGVVNFYIQKFHGSDIKKSGLVKSVLDDPNLNTWLGSTIKQQAAREALDMLAGTNRKKSNKKIGLPSHNGKRMSLTDQSVQIQKSKTAYGFDFWLHLASIGNKIVFDIPLKSHKHFKRLMKRGTLLKSFVITSKGVQLCFEIETGTKKTEGSDVGIDVGVNSLLSLSNGKRYGNIKPILEKIDRKQQGSKKQQQARRHLKQHINETIKHMFEIEQPRTVVVEKLKGLKHKTKSKRRSSRKHRRFIGAWTYRYLLDRIQMTAEDNRVVFRSVNPSYTSIRCLVCGHTDKGNRSNEVFLCRNCGHSDNADVNASKNILNLFSSGAWRYSDSGEPQYGTACKDQSQNKR